MTEWDFIKATARGPFGVSYNTYKKWRVNGVPHKFRLALIEEAERAGFALDRSAFDNPPGRQKAAAA